MDSEAGMRRRFAYALNTAMARKGWKPPDLARAIKRDASTVARWANAETAPGIFMLKALSEALGVRPEFLFDPPPVPAYPLDDYLVAAADSGAEEGRRRATNSRGTGAPDTRRDTPSQRVRGGGE